MYYISSEKIWKFRGGTWPPSPALPPPPPRPLVAIKSGITWYIGYNLLVVHKMFLLYWCVQIIYAKSSRSFPFEITYSTNSPNWLKWVLNENCSKSLNPKQEKAEDIAKEHEGHLMELIGNGHMCLPKEFSFEPDLFLLVRNCKMPSKENFWPYSE